MLIVNRCSTVFGGFFHAVWGFELGGNLSKYKLEKLVEEYRLILWVDVIQLQ